jgi:Leucine-rich repeat (LRR) protein
MSGTWTTRVNPANPANTKWNDANTRVRIIPDFKLSSLNLGWNVIDVLLSAAPSLTSLDLSWNPLREKGAIALAEAIRASANGNLRHLNLAHSHVSETACVLLAALLRHQTNLTVLQMCGNRIGFHGARALFRLLSVRLCFGGKEKKEGRDRGGEEEEKEAAKPLWISRSACSLTASSKLGAFQRTSAGNLEWLPLRVHRADGIYILDLSIYNDRAVALELAFLSADLARQAGVRIDSNSANTPACWKVCRKLFTKDVNSKAELDPWSIQPDSLPLQGILEVQFESPLMPCPMTPSLNHESLALVLKVATGEMTNHQEDRHCGTSIETMTHQHAAQPSISDMERCELISASLINGHWRFSVGQVDSIMSKVTTMSEKIKLAARLLPFIVDLENASVLWSSLQTRHINRLQSLVGEMLFFNPLRPIRRWRLNLALDHDRVLALRLREMSAREKDERKLAHLPDTSQLGNGEMWRNVCYTGKSSSNGPAAASAQNNKGKGNKDQGPDKKDNKAIKVVETKTPVAFQYSSDWLIPQFGLLELDYVTCHRPKSQTLPISDDVFKEHIKGTRRTVQLTLSQTTESQLSSCFGPAALRPITQVLLRLPVSAAQAVTLCTNATIVGQVPFRHYPATDSKLETEEEDFNVSEKGELDQQHLSELKVH